MKMISSPHAESIFEGRSLVAAANQRNTWPIEQATVAAWRWLGRFGGTAFRAMRRSRLRFELAHVTDARMRLFESAWNDRTFTGTWERAASEILARRQPPFPLPFHSFKLAVISLIDRSKIRGDRDRKQIGDGDLTMLNLATFDSPASIRDAQRSGDFHVS